MANYAILESWRDFSSGLSSIQMEKPIFPWTMPLKIPPLPITGWLLSRNEVIPIISVSGSRINISEPIQHQSSVLFSMFWYLNHVKAPLSDPRIKSWFNPNESAMASSRSPTGTRFLPSRSPHLLIHPSVGPMEEGFFIKQWRSFQQATLDCLSAIWYILIYFGEIYQIYLDIYLIYIWYILVYIYKYLIYVSGILIYGLLTIARSVQMQHWGEHWDLSQQSDWGWKLQKPRELIWPWGLKGNKYGTYGTG